MTLRVLWEPGFSALHEVLAPTMIDYASPEVAAAMVPRLLRGDEMWCQGFSEPGTGSNLASLSCRAVRDGDAWRVNGQKVWTSLAQFSQRCVLLTRTGTPESAHRGITALFVDMDSPGITVRPIEAMHGHEEFCEVFFDDVAVPLDRTLGDEGQGWAVAMDILPYERSTALWQRGAYLHERLRWLVESAPPGALDPGALGEVIQIVGAFPRGRGRRSTASPPVASSGPRRRSTRSCSPLPSSRCSTWPTRASAPRSWRATSRKGSGGGREYMYSRAATIYGGSAEIQRNIIARRLLDLGSDR